MVRFILEAWAAPASQRMATFEDFLPTRGTATPLELSRALASGRPDGPRLLVLHGPPGVGKTHLLRAIAHAVRLGVPSILVVQTSALDIVEHMIALLRRNRPADFHRLWPANALVTIDDLHVLRDRAATQREVGLLIRESLERGVRIVCAAGCRPSQIPALSETLGALPAGRRLALRRPSIADMRGILREMSRVEGLRLRASALASVAAGCHGDVRRAVSAIAHRRFEAAAAG